MTDTTVRPAAPPRWISLEGPVNFRDLGGYLTSAGEIVRWRQVFRSDAIETSNGRDVEELIEAVGLRAAVDLRPADEVGGAPIRRLAESGIEWRRAPLLVDGPCMDPLFTPGVALEDLYLFMLRRLGPDIVAALELITAAPKPVVFHCGAGKDRTGLVAAVLLGVLGVSDDDISRDYALSAGAMPTILERARRRPSPLDASYPPEVFRADAGAMRRVLAALRDNHGSVLGYAFDNGLSLTTIETLQSTLLQ